MPDASDGDAVPSGWASFGFPPGAVACRPGDYLICRDAAARWTVYRVQDLLLVKRLVAPATGPAMLVLEEDLLDSMTPAYVGQVQVLVTAFDPDFADESAAREAIERQALTERVQGLLRPAQDFREADCRVVPATGAHPSR